MTQPQPEPDEPDAAPAQSTPTCWWHPERPTGLRCTRCERSACPECLREASVGYQCIDCVSAGRRQDKARAAVHRRSGLGHRTVAGARASAQAVVTPVLVALNVLVFAVTVIQAQSLVDNDGSPVFSDGVLWPPVVAGGEWWRIVTAGFLHFGPFHLLMNMLALWFLGRDLEQLLGKLRFTALYGLSLLGGSLAVYLFEDIDRATAGASGAIYGLLGGILVAAIRLRLDLTYILVVIGINAVISFQVEGISWLGHLGGFVVGSVVTAALVYAPAKARVPVQIGTMLAVGAALVALVFYRDAQFVEEYGQPVCNPAGNSCGFIRPNAGG